jgi:gamma-glutamylcyclotransferase (GGCT)/AIG2-like uncharacterized protein YtfP
MRLFVFGTLKRGYWNHARFIGGSPLVGTGRTVHKYVMYGGGFPLIASDLSWGKPVTGEVYDFDPRGGRLARLDCLEGAYERVRGLIQMDDGRTLWCSYYIIRDPDLRGRQANRAWDCGDCYTWESRR